MGDYEKNTNKLQNKWRYLRRPLSAAAVPTTRRDNEFYSVPWRVIYVANSPGGFLTSNSDVMLPACHCLRSPTTFVALEECGVYIVIRVQVEPTRSVWRSVEHRGKYRFSNALDCRHLEPTLSTSTENPPTMDSGGRR